MIMNRDVQGPWPGPGRDPHPWAIPTAVTAKLWFFIFAFEGIANNLLGRRDPARCLDRGRWPARFAIIIADVWKTTPFMALFILAGLQIIGADVYEAAKIDGATKWQTFTRITIPLVKVPLMVAVLFRTLDVLRIYDLPAILTNGGGGTGATTTLSILVIDQIRGGFNSASALSTIVFSSSRSRHSSSSSSAALTWCNGHPRRRSASASAAGRKAGTLLRATPTSPAASSAALAKGGSRHDDADCGYDDCPQGNSDGGAAPAVAPAGSTFGCTAAWS